MAFVLQLHCAPLISCFSINALYYTYAAGFKTAGKLSLRIVTLTISVELGSQYFLLKGTFIVIRFHFSLSLSIFIEKFKHVSAIRDVILMEVIIRGSNRR